MNILAIINKLNDPIRHTVVSLATHGYTLSVHSVNGDSLSYEVVYKSKSVFKATLYAFPLDLTEHIIMLEMIRKQFGGTNDV